MKNLQMRRQSLLFCLKRAALAFAFSWVFVTVCEKEINESFESDGQKHHDKFLKPARLNYKLQSIPISNKYP